MTQRIPIKALGAGEQVVIVLSITFQSLRCVDYRDSSSSRAVHSTRNSGRATRAHIKAALNDFYLSVENTFGLPMWT